MSVNTSNNNNTNSNKSNIKSENRITHVIFDLDGTLIDTELWGLNNANVVLATYGKQCDVHTYSKVLGLDPLDRSEHLIQEFGIDCEKEEFLKVWITECRKSLTSIQLMPGVQTLVEHLYEQGIPLAIATVGKELEFASKTQHLKHMFEEGGYFQHIVHGDDQRVKRLKPYPDLYEVCAALFTPKPQPKNILVFEDNLIGLEAALSAGMQTVLVNDQRFTDIKESKADLVINSLNEFKPEMFGFKPFL